MRNVSPVDEKIFSKRGRRSAVRLERVCAFLRAAHPTKTADSAAAATGIGSGTIRKWLEGKSSPSGVAVAVLTMVYGPEFLCAIMDAPPAWIDLAARTERRDRVTAQIANLTEQLRQDSA